MRFILLFLFSFSAIAQQPRTIVTTDGEIDDVDSFIRMLLYANEFKLEGLIYSSSMWHYKGDGKGTKFISEMDMTKKLYAEKTDLRWPGVNWIEELLDEYTKIHPNLLLHDKKYPSPSYLRSLIRVGNIEFEGEMDKDTPGSDFIKAKLLDGDLSPLYLQVWGGTNTISRALKSIEEEYAGKPNWKAVYDKVCKKSVIYAILDQDATYRKYVAVKWPDMKIYYNSKQFWCFAYPWPRALTPDNQTWLKGDFMGEHIINNHGTLLQKYYSYGDGQKQEGDDEHIHGDLSKLSAESKAIFGKYDFLSEGDSPAYLHLVDVGLNNLKDPSVGGWGGRLVQSVKSPNRWEDGAAAADFNHFTQKMDETFAQTRWVPAIQSDFAARADWCIKPYKEANHAPILSTDKNSLRLSKGQKGLVKLNIVEPDNQDVFVKYWQYAESGTGISTLEVKTKDSRVFEIEIPSLAKKGETYHFILEVTDNAQHPITRYKRVVVTVI